MKLFIEVSITRRSFRLSVETSKHFTGGAVPRKLGISKTAVGTEDVLDELKLLRKTMEHIAKKHADTGDWHTFPIKSDAWLKELDKKISRTIKNATDLPGANR